MVSLFYISDHAHIEEVGREIQFYVLQLPNQELPFSSRPSKAKPQSRSVVRAAAVGAKQNMPENYPA